MNNPSYHRRKKFDQNKFQGQEKEVEVAKLEKKFGKEKKKKNFF